MQLEAQTYQRIQEKIHERVMNNLGTWIDWQYMQNAAKLLAKVSTMYYSVCKEHVKEINTTIGANVSVIIL